MIQWKKKDNLNSSRFQVILEFCQEILGIGRAHLRVHGDLSTLELDQVLPVIGNNEIVEYFGIVEPELFRELV